MTEATVEEEEGTHDAGKIVARAKGGAINLARIAGRTILARAPGGISLARIAPCCLTHLAAGYDAPAPPLA